MASKGAAGTGNSTHDKATCGCPICGHERKRALAEAMFSPAAVPATVSSQPSASKKTPSAKKKLIPSQAELSGCESEAELSGCESEETVELPAPAPPPKKARKQKVSKRKEREVEQRPVLNQAPVLSQAHAPTPTAPMSMIPCNCTACLPRYNSICSYLCTNIDILVLCICLGHTITRNINMCT